MSSRAVAMRRVAFWTVLLTGVALVSLQFACDRPQTTLSAPGFPHASRASTRLLEPELERETSGPTLISAWSQPRKAEALVAKALTRKAPPVETPAGGTAPSPPGPTPADGPVRLPGVEPPA